MRCLNLRPPTNWTPSVSLVILLAVCFLLCFAEAQNDLSIGSFPAELTAGEPVEIQWEGGNGRTVGIYLRGYWGASLDTFEKIADATENPYIWTPSRALISAQAYDYDILLSQEGSHDTSSPTFSIAPTTSLIELLPATSLEPQPSTTLVMTDSATSSSLVKKASSSSTAAKHSKTAESSLQKPTSSAGTSNGMAAGTKAGIGLAIPLGILLIGGAGFLLGRRLNGNNAKTPSTAPDNLEVVENRAEPHGSSSGWKFWSVGRAELPTAANAHELPTEVESIYELDGGRGTER